MNLHQFQVGQQTFCQESHFNLKLFFFFVFSLETAKAYHRLGCFLCFHETWRREEVKSLCLPSVCEENVWESRHRRNLGQEKYSMSFWPKSWSIQPAPPYLPERLFGWLFFFFFVWCLFSDLDSEKVSFYFFPVFLQSLRAFSRSAGKMLNYKEHPSALFQDVVCSSNTIQCLYKGPGARNELTHIFIKF